MSTDDCTILLIQKDYGDQRLFNEMLAKAPELDCSMLTADDLDNGIKCLAGGGIDVVLYDLATPGRNGDDDLANLRRTAGDTPILVLNDDEDPHLAAKALRSGAEDFLVKDTIHTSMLSRVIQTARHRRHYRDVWQSRQPRMNALIIHNADAIVVLNRLGIIRFANPAAEGMFGRQAEELIGTAFGFPLVGDASTEIDILHRGGERRVAEMRLVETEWGEEPAYLASLRDITVRKHAEDKLRKYERIMASTSSPIALVDRDYNLEAVNEAFREWFLARNETGPRVQLKTVIGEHNFETQIACSLAHCLAGEEIHKQGQLKLPDGSVRYAEMAFYPYFDADRSLSGVIWNLRDISQTKSLEDQLRQSQKMEAIGTLAGGIAHNFNNLLMGIQGRVSLMRIDADADHPFKEHLEGIEDQVRSAADLTKQLLGYARGGKYEPVPTDMNLLVARNFAMFGRTRREIEMHESYGENLWSVEIDQNQFSQVLVNLFVNAWQAMPGGGTLSVTTANTELDRELAKAHGIDAGRYVRVDVIDTGKGMDADTLKRIFDPFFTTKKGGRGSGLGLASVYGIVSNHNGAINVESEMGTGTTFSIYLPASERVPRERRRPAIQPLKGHETVLLVDDEEEVLKIGRLMLLKLGYRVLLSASGQEALATYREKGADIDLVILDMIMPGMSGSDTFDQLRRLNPEVKVLLASGYSINRRANHILARGCDGFLPKPFDLPVLSQKLRCLLDQPSESQGLAPG
ncbi:MAG: response regulator [Desulfobacterales bacterium]|nr:response regulator [Desulfobacterales bacterium]